MGSQCDEDAIDYGIEKKPLAPETSLTTTNRWSSKRARSMVAKAIRHLGERKVFTV